MGNNLKTNVNLIYWKTSVTSILSGIEIKMLNDVIQFILLLFMQCT